MVVSSSCCFLKYRADASVHVGGACAASCMIKGGDQSYYEHVVDKWLEFSRITALGRASPEGSSSEVVVS